MDNTKDKLLKDAACLLAASVINGQTVTRGKHRGWDLVLFTPRMLRERRRLIRRILRCVPK